MQPAQEHTLRPFVEGVQIGEAVGHRNLTLVPLRGEGSEPLIYRLAAEAILAGQLSISEVSEGGSVPELLAVNQSDQPILLLDGEELVGAKQNRILNTSVLLSPNSKTKIPVSCVEQGRWHMASQSFSTGSYSPAKLRARKSKDVTASYLREGTARGDQGAVWEEVACSLDALSAPSPTMAMHDAVHHQQDHLESYLQALPCPQNARGVVVGIGGRFVAMDLFDQASTLQSVWPRLLTGYALDALAAKKDPSGTFTARGAGELLLRLADQLCQPCPSLGLGEDWRFDSPDLVGQALVAEGTCVHLCAFPVVGESRPASRPGILPPSQRRRGHNPDASC